MLKKISGALKLVLVCTVAILLIIPSSAFAWGGVGKRGGSLSSSNSGGHGYIAIQAYEDVEPFKEYITRNNLTNTLLTYVAEADVPAEKTYVAHLDDQYTDVDIWEHPSDINSINHCASGIRYKMAEDPRLHNSIECLKLALRLKSSEPETAMRIFANGMHLAQDYFAHLNAPGGTGSTPHGLPSDLLVDTDKDGIPDKRAGLLNDSMDWDVHNGGEDDTIPWSKKAADCYEVSQWHKHENRADNWRVNASIQLCVEYMKAYMSESVIDYVDVLNKGYVVNHGKTTYIDLLTRTPNVNGRDAAAEAEESWVEDEDIVKVIVDNTDSGFTTDSPWTSSKASTALYGVDYTHDGTAAADASSRWAKWTPDIQEEGSYKIYMRWAANKNRADAAPLEIAYKDGMDTSKTVNQQKSGNRWNLIGIYTLSAGTGNYIKILATSKGYTVADAVAFVKSSEPADESVNGGTVTPSVTSKVNYEDLADYSWAKEAIEVMASKGFIIGTGEKTFAPGTNIKRADFTMLAVKSLGLIAKADDNFADVNKDAHYYESVGIAKSLGIVIGSEGNKFNPDEEISRQDMMVITARAMRIAKMLNSTGTIADLAFSDNLDIASYAVEDVAAIVKEGLVKGNDNKMNPLGSTTRAEAAVLMHRIYSRTPAATVKPADSAAVEQPKPAESSKPKETPIRIIIDNIDSGFITDSPWTVSSTSKGFYGNDYVHDGTSKADGAGRWAKWTPDIPREGNYKVYIKWASHNNRAQAAPLEIKYRDGTDTSKKINQTEKCEDWYYLGTYNLSAGTDNYVKILATDKGYTVADAVMFVKE